MSRKVNCKFCGREVDIRGIRLHELKCRYDYDQKKENKENKEVIKETKKQTNNNNLCPDCKSDNIKLLNSNNQIHKQAIAQGNTKYCLNCEEVF